MQSYTIDCVLIMLNRQVILINRPSGIAQAEDFEIVENSVPNISDGQFLVQNLFLSVEPAMRGWIADKNNYSAPVAIGAPMRAISVGKIVASKHDGFAVDDHVCGWFGWQDFCAATPDMVIRKITEHDLPLSLHLGILGINGITAYLAMTNIGRPKPGDMVVVSSAAGAVGSIAGQIANIMGAQTIGLTGNDGKVELCKRTYGYTAALNYKTDDLGKALTRLCPNGVDVYYDNTAGTISDSVIKHIALNARIVICGTAAISSWDDWPSGPRIERHLLVKRAMMQGFVIFDYKDQYETSIARLAKWIRKGKLQYREDILQGMECAPDALAGLYRGENMGKRIIQISIS